jgi:pimeloyl-ACP methyl ester carboxylesterase
VSWLDQWRRRTREAPLYTEIHGDGEDTLVFIAGLGGTTRYWASRLAPIENCYRIVLVDLLGFGQSPKPWTQYSVERHIEALRAALECLGPITLIGHSLGALVTVAYAARYPEQVNNIVVMGMPSFGSQERAYRYFRSGRVKYGYVYTSVVLTMAACIVTRRVVGWLLPYVVRSVPREVAEDLVKHTWRSSTSSLWEVVYRYNVARDMRDLPTRIGVLFIHGDLDIMAPLSHIEELAARHSGWRLWVLPGVDHHPFLRDPEGCLAAIDTTVTKAGNATGFVALSNDT